jgi:hypothetical protein
MKLKETRSALTRRHAHLLAPLNKKEERIATRSAEEHLGSISPHGQERRFRVLGADLRIEKAERPSEPPLRFTRVVIVDYSQKQNLSVLIDRKGKVARVEKMRGQPVFHEDEVQEAREIAERDDRLAQVRKLRGLFVSTYAPPTSFATDARIVGLHYVVSRSQRQHEMLASVAVDLSERRTVSVTVYSHEGR